MPTASNALVAMATMLRAQKPGSRREWRDAKFLISALQSGIFNLVLERRVADGTWNRALDGDILHRERSMPGEPEQRFAQFHVDDVALCDERVRTFELSATGPMPGVEMLAPTGKVLELEQAATAEIAGADLDWSAVRRFGEGTRRPLRLRVRELAWTWGEHANSRGRDNPNRKRQECNARPGGCVRVAKRCLRDHCARRGVRTRKRAEKLARRPRIRRFSQHFWGRLATAAGSCRLTVC
jgi:hypothetical protein